MHAITMPHDPRELLESTRRSAALYLACGIDPAKSSVFVQSHVTAHAELTWLLSCITPVGWLRRMTQYKEKSKSQVGKPNHSSVDNGEGGRGGGVQLLQ